MKGTNNASKEVRLAKAIRHKEAQSMLNTPSVTKSDSVTKSELKQKEIKRLKSVISNLEWEVDNLMKI